MAATFVSRPYRPDADLSRRQAAVSAADIELGPSPRRASDLVQYLRDGIFLDGQTQAISLQVAVYNWEVGIVATSSVELTWAPSGLIRVESDVGLVPLVSQQYSQGATGAGAPSLQARCRSALPTGRATTFSCYY